MDEELYLLFIMQYSKKLYDNLELVRMSAAVGRYINRK